MPSFEASGFGHYQRQKDTRLDGPLVFSNMAIPLFLDLDVSVVELH